MALKKIATENFEIESHDTFYRIEVLGCDSVNPEIIYVDNEKIDELIDLLDKARSELG